MDDDPPPPLSHDVNFRTSPGGFEIWFADRIAEDHADLVDECADWLEDEVGAVNLGQIEHRTLLADGVLSDRLQQDIVGWWVARVPELSAPCPRWIPDLP